MSGQLTGRVALVTGSTRGIGKGIALSLANSGATVIVTGRSEAAAHAVVDEIRTSGGQAHSVVADLDFDDAVDGLVPAATAVAGKLDILVNNAGVDGDHPVAGYPLELWRKILRTNLEIPFRLAQAAGEKFLEQGRGVVINIASIQGQIGCAENCAYAASKHGLVGLTKVLAIEWASRGVRANAIAPGLVDTDMVQSFVGSSYLEAWLQAYVPAKRVGSTQNVGDLAAFLASDAAEFIHGAVIPCDGGYLAM